MCAPGFPFCVEKGAVYQIPCWPFLNRNCVRFKQWKSKAKASCNLRRDRVFNPFNVTTKETSPHSLLFHPTAWTSPFPTCMPASVGTEVVLERNKHSLSPTSPPATDSSETTWDHGARKEAVDGDKLIPSSKPLYRLQWIKGSQTWEKRKHWQLSEASHSSTAWFFLVERHHVLGDTVDHLLVMWRENGHRRKEQCHHLKYPQQEYRALVPLLLWVPLSSQGEAVYHGNELYTVHGCPTWQAWLKTRVR